MHPLHHAALAEGILAADPRHPPQHHRQNSADHVKHDAQGLNLEHREGQHGQHQGHQRHPAVHIKHRIGHPAAVVLAVGPYPDLLLHMRDVGFNCFDSFLLKK